MNDPEACRNGGWWRDPANDAKTRAAPARLHQITVVATLATLLGCASGAPQTDMLISSEDAVALWRSGKARIVDTRHPHERGEATIPGALAVPFGPARWSTDPATHRGEEFAAAVAAAGVTRDDEVVMVCNAGVRARSAAAFLRDRGYSRSRAVVGGFLGKGADPGWQFFQ